VIRGRQGGESPEIRLDLDVAHRACRAIHPRRGGLRTRSERKLRRRRARRASVLPASWGVRRRRGGSRTELRHTSVPCIVGGGMSEPRRQMRRRRSHHFDCIEAEYDGEREGKPHRACRVFVSSASSRSTPEKRREATPSSSCTIISPTPSGSMRIDTEVEGGCNCLPCWFFVRDTLLLRGDLSSSLTSTAATVAGLQFQVSYIAPSCLSLESMACSSCIAPRYLPPAHHHDSTLLGEAPAHKHP